jgi:hypothetical protein
MSAVIDWVERGIAPPSLTATRVEDGAVVRSASFARTEPR